MSCSAAYQEGWQTYQVSADISLAAVSQSYDNPIKAHPVDCGGDPADLCPCGAGLLPLFLQAAHPYLQCGKADDQPGYDMEV